MREKQAPIEGDPQWQNISIKTKQQSCNERKETKEEYTRWVKNELKNRTAEDS